MAAGYFEAGKTREQATFEMFVRRLPPNRKFLVAAGLAQAVEYLQNLAFTGEDIDYLRTLGVFASVSPGYWEMLREFRFTGDLFAVREGTPVFPGEPILVVRAPIVEAQIPETFLLSAVGFQTLIATKAARIVEAAKGKSIVEFGTRHAHSPDAGVVAARAAYIGGCIGTSNVEAGRRWQIPVFGTAAHSWVQSFSGEITSYKLLQKLLGEATVYLIDTYDTIEGARRAAQLGKPLWGVRLDSGNLADLSKAVRKILDDAGLRDAKIMASGDVNEYRLLELAAAGAPIDTFGVGTDLSTSGDSPNLSAVYKLVEVEVQGIKRYTAKFSADKNTLPGAKQIFRYADRDVVSCSWECPTDGPQALLRPVMIGGQVVEPLPSASEARDHAAASIAKLPVGCRMLSGHDSPWRVEYSSDLMKLLEQARRNVSA